MKVRLSKQTRARLLDAVDTLTQTARVSSVDWSTDPRTTRDRLIDVAVTDWLNRHPFVETPNGEWSNLP